MKILRLASSRVLLWAHERGGDGPYEVSKVVDRPLQPHCQSAPRCPGSGEGIDPSAAPAARCPYVFDTRGECLRTRNQLALEAALFRPGEVLLTRRLLEALGFEVQEEAIDPAADEGRRVLTAHGALGRKELHVRLLRSPAAGPIVLVRAQQRGQRGRAVPSIGSRP